MCNHKILMRCLRNSTARCEISQLVHDNVLIDYKTLSSEPVYPLLSAWSIFLDLCNSLPANKIYCQL